MSAERLSWKLNLLISTLNRALSRCSATILKYNKNHMVLPWKLDFVLRLLKNILHRISESFINTLPLFCVLGTSILIQLPNLPVITVL